ncbi:Fructose-bisphosphate aldolase, partial [Scytalidium lignicola]
MSSNEEGGAVSAQNKSSWSAFLKSIASFNGDLSSLTAPPFILSATSLVEFSSYWAQHPSLFIAPASEKDPQKRALLVLKWFLSTLKQQYASRSDEFGNEKKPLNAFLGELFLGKWEDEAGTTELISEQVSHHPPATAYYIHNKEHGVSLQGYNAQKASFSSTIYVKQIGHAVYSIPAYDETYLITLPSLHIEGLIFGAPFVELESKTYITSSSGYTAKIEYSGKGWLSGKKNGFAATLYPTGKEGTILYNAAGQWSKSFDIREGSHKSGPLIETFDANAAAVTPLQIAPIEKQDQLESRRAWAKVAAGIAAGDMEVVGNEKTLIEVAQRELRAKEKAEGRVWERRYFSVVEGDSIVDQLAPKIGLNVEADKTGGIWRYDEKKGAAVQKALSSANMAQRDRDHAHNMMDEEINATDANTFSGGRDKPIFRQRNLDTGYSSVLQPALSRSTTGGWMSGRTRGGPGLRSAFERTEQEPEFAPTDLRRGGRGNLGSNSRIPKTRSYVRETTLTPPVTHRDEFRPSETDERSASAPTGSHIKKNALRIGSPSPLPRARGRSTGDEERLKTIRKGALHFKTGRESPLRRNSVGVKKQTDDDTKVSSGSSLSGFSLPEDPVEDEFDRKMIQYLKDQERYVAATSSRNGLFNKADVGHRDTEKGDSKKSSESNIDSEPPIRLPNTWGSKARKNEGWLSKIISPEASLDGKTSPLPTVESDASKDVPLPSVENQQSQQEPTPPSSRPTSTKPSNVSPEKSKLWDADLDFTAHSLQVSSPNFVIKRTKLDEIRDAEVQSLLPRAVAQSRLEDIKERNSEERSLSPEAERTTAKAAPLKEGLDTADFDQTEPLHDRTILEEEGEPIPGTPITIFSRGSGPRTSDFKPTGDGAKVTDPGHAEVKRDQYRDTLRSLARIASTSPSSSPSDRPVENDRKANEDKLASKKTEKLDLPVSEAEKKRYSTSSDTLKSDIDPEERIVQEQKLFDLPDEKPEKNSARTSSPPPDESEDLETPRPKRNVLSMPTPKVTGAYIETPAPTIQRPSTSPSRSPPLKVKKESDDDMTANPSEDARRRQLSDNELESNTSRPSSSNSDATITKPRARPPMVNTAKRASVSDDLNHIRKEIDMDDSTLDDFDAIIEAQGNGVSDNTTILEDIIDLEYDHTGRPLTQKQKERRLELLTLERMNKSLKSTSTSITEAKRGIERLEKKVSASASAAAAATSASTPKSNAHHSHADCPECAANSSVYHFSIPIPRLLTPERTGSGRRNLTWFGLITLIFSVWYVSESVMCEYFCHPTYSSSNNWSPSDPFFPYAIPTKLDQWTGEVVSGALDMVSNAVWSAWTDGKKPSPHIGYSWGSAVPAGYGGWMGSQKQAVRSYGSDDDMESSIFEDERI